MFKVLQFCINFVHRAKENENGWKIFFDLVEVVNLKSEWKFSINI